MKKMKILLMLLVGSICAQGQVIVLHDEYAGTGWDKMVYDPDRDELWLGSSSFSGGEKLVKRDAQNQKVTLPDLLPNQNIQNVSSLSYHEGKVYVGSYENALELNLSTQTVTSLGSGGSAIYADLFYDPINMRVTLGNYATSIDYWDGNSWKSDNRIKAVIDHSYDKERNELWMLGAFKKLYKMSSSGLETMDVGVNGIPDLPYYKVVHGPREHLYLITVDQGFAHYDGTTWKHISSSNSDLRSFDINDAAVDSQGRLWLAQRFGVTYYNGSTSTFIDLLKGLNVNFIDMESIAIDKEGHIWSGSSAGLVELVLQPSAVTDQDTDLNIYPNPVTDLLNIEYEKPISSLSIYSIHGEMVMSLYGLHENKMDVSGLAQGTYILDVKFTNGTRVTNKLIKQ